MGVVARLSTPREGEIARASSLAQSHAAWPDLAFRVLGCALWGRQRDWLLATSDYRPICEDLPARDGVIVCSRTVTMTANLAANTHQPRVHAAPFIDAWFHDVGATIGDETDLPAHRGFRMAAPDDPPTPPEDSDPPPPRPAPTEEEMPEPEGTTNPGIKNR